MTDKTFMRADEVAEELDVSKAEEMFSRLVKQLAEKENVTEKLKAEN